MADSTKKYVTKSEMPWVKGNGVNSAQMVNCFAEGGGSVAEGEDTEASGSTSHAEGYSTRAYGENSHAEGQSTSAAGNCSHAEGYSSETGGNATGYKTTAGSDSNNGMYAHAEGNSCIAKGANSHAEGKQTFASGKNSHTEGFKTRALSNQAHAEGNNTETAGSYSHAEGNRTYTGSAAYASHVEGGFCKAYGQAAHAEGYGACARANHSHAEAFNSFFFVYVTGSANATSYSFTINEASVTFNELGQTNFNNIFIGNIIFVNESSDAVEITGFSGSLSGGNYVGTLTVNKTLSTNALTNQQCLVPSTIALANAHAEGRAAIAAGETSHAEGLYTNTKNEAEHAEGKYNKSNTHATESSKQTLHSVGCGDSTTRKNAFEIMQNGDVYVKGVGGYDGTNAGQNMVFALKEILGNILYFEDSYLVWDTESVADYISTYGYVDLTDITGIRAYPGNYVKMLECVPSEEVRQIILSKVNDLQQELNGYNIYRAYLDKCAVFDYSVDLSGDINHLWLFVMVEIEDVDAQRITYAFVDIEE